MREARRVMEPDVYDALDMSSHAAGGIGHGKYFDVDGMTPLCIVGHAQFVDNLFFGPVMDELARLGISTANNDRAVCEVLQREGREDDEFARIPFQAWAKALNIVRRKE